MSIKLYRLERMTGDDWKPDTEHRYFTDKRSATRMLTELRGFQPRVMRRVSHTFVLPDGTEASEPTCLWFMLCMNDATGTLEVPGLGPVPICDRCRKIAGL